MSLFPPNLKTSIPFTWFFVQGRVLSDTLKNSTFNRLTIDFEFPFFK